MSDSQAPEVVRLNRREERRDGLATDAQPITLKFFSLLLTFAVACTDTAKPLYAECLLAEVNGDVPRAVAACKAAVAVDPSSRSGKAAAEKLTELEVASEKGRLGLTGAPGVSASTRPPVPESPVDDDAALARRAFVDQLNAKFLQATGAPRLRIGAAPGATTLVMLSINDCNEATLRALVAKNADGLVDTWRNKGFKKIACDGTTGNRAEVKLEPDSAPLPPHSEQPDPPVAMPTPTPDKYELNRAACHPCSTQEDFDVAWQKKMKCCPVRGCEGDSDCLGSRVCCRIPMGTLCTDPKRCGGSDRVP